MGGDGWKAFVVPVGHPLAENYRKILPLRSRFLLMVAYWRFLTLRKRG